MQQEIGTNDEQSYFNIPPPVNTNKFKKAKDYMPPGFYKPKRQEDIDNYFSLICDLHYDTIFKMIMRRTNDNDLAWDLTQETFYRTFKKFDGLKDTEKMKAYLTKTALNLLHKEARTASSHAPLLEKYRELQDERKKIGLDLDLNCIHHDLRDVLLSGFKELAAGNMNELFMFGYMGMSYDDIADVLNASLDAIKTRIYRQRKFMKKYLSSRGIDACFLSR